MAPRNKKRQRGTATALVAVSMIGGIQARPAFAQNPAAAEDRGVRRYDIPAGPLETVARRLPVGQRRHGHVPADVVRGITSPGVSGHVHGRAGPRRSCSTGTSLAFRFTAPFAAIVEIRIASESVEVTRADAPRVAEIHRAAAQHAADDHRDSRRR